MNKQDFFVFLARLDLDQFWKGNDGFEMRIVVIFSLVILVVIVVFFGFLLLVGRDI